MKKFLTLTIIAIIALIGLSVSVNAAEVTVDSEAALKTAITGTDTTIILDAEVTLTEKLVIPADVKVVLNLNGKTLNLANIAGNYAVVINGELTITGNGIVNVPGVYGIGTSTSGGKLTIENGTFNHNHSDGYYLIGNYGTVVINGGTFNGKYCAVNGFANGSAVEINGGTFNSTDGWTILGKLEINDGTFNGGTDGLVLYTDTSIEINGGDFFGKSEEIYVYTDNPDAKVTINDGTFKGGEYGITIEGEGNTEITGGAFDTDISDFVTGEYDWNYDDEGNMVVFIPIYLDKPTNVKWDGTKATWDAVPNAEGYGIMLTNGEWNIQQPIWVEAEDTSYDFSKYLTDKNGEYVFIVWAEGNGNPYYYSDDATSEAYVFPVEEEKPTVGEEGTATQKPAEGEKDETPKTGSVDVVLFASAMVAVISIAGIVTVKKYTK